MRVLLVDDNREVRQRLRRLIEEIPGVEIVGEAAGVQEAIDQLGRSNADLVILDLRLADGTGFELLAFLQTQESPPRTVVLSNYAENAYRRRSEQLGAFRFLDKSKEIEELGELLVTMGDDLLVGTDGS